MKNVWYFVYSVQCYTALYNEPLFGESCEAWRYGPVVPAVYQKTKDYGRKPIIKDIFIEDNKIKGICPADKETLDLIEEIWRKFGSWSGGELSAWSHREGSAWDIAYYKEGGHQYIGYDIATDLLKEEFAKLIIVDPKHRENHPGWEKNERDI